MSIATKLQKILDSKAAIKTAIAGKGGTITDATPLDEYAQAVNSIPDTKDAFIKSLCEKTITELDFPQGTESIGAHIFNAQVYLQRLHIPSSVKTIGTEAFYNVPRLTQITIDEGLETIGDKALGIAAFTTIEFPDSIKTIGDYVLIYCYQLEKVVVGSGCETIMRGLGYYTRKQGEIIICKAVNPPTLGGALFPNNYTTGKIYVPDASVNAYKTATNWSTWASYIYPLSDYQP